MKKNMDNAIKDKLNLICQLGLFIQITSEDILGQKAKKANLGAVKITWSNPLDHFKEWIAQ